MFLPSPEQYMYRAFRQYEFKRLGANMRRKAMVEIYKLMPPMYNQTEPIIKGEGPESSEELNDETLNCGQEGI